MTKVSVPSEQGFDNINSKFNNSKSTFEINLYTGMIYEWNTAIQISYSGFDVLLKKLKILRS